ncbi:hypothetical protein ACLOJK_001980 [Asimina triloba]
MVGMENEQRIAYTDYNVEWQLLDPKTVGIHAKEQLLSAVRLLVAEDPCEGKFVFGRQELKPSKSLLSVARGKTGYGGDNPKNQLQTLLVRAGHEAPHYSVKQLKNSQFRAMVEFNGMQFVGQPCSSKKLSEREAAAEAIQWLTGETTSSHEDIDHMSMLLPKSSNKKNQGKHRIRRGIIIIVNDDTG